MRDNVAAGVEPWKRGFEALRSNPRASHAYRLRGPFDRVSRRPQLHKAEIDDDCTAAYYNALMWAVTGERAHADKAIEILNAWSGRLEAILPADAELLAGLNGSHFVNAAEIIRHTGAGWKPEDVARAGRMFRGIFYPVVKDFAETAIGNWGAACIKTAMAIGVFCDDREIFERAVAHYRAGGGNGSLAAYVVNDEGQCQESGRDQAHAQLGLGSLAEAAEIAQSQGIDLYGALDNRLLKGFEYTARYNLGLDVPFAPAADRTGKYRFEALSPEHRGEFRPIYELVWNHYVNRRGLHAPYTRRVADALRPEGDGPRPQDQPGFGTLLFSLRSDP